MYCRIFAGACNVAGSEQVSNSSEATNASIACLYAVTSDFLLDYQLNPLMNLRISAVVASWPPMSIIMPS